MKELIEILGSKRGYGGETITHSVVIARAPKEPVAISSCRHLNYKLAMPSYQGSQ